MNVIISRSVCIVWRRTDLPLDWNEQEFSTQSVQMLKILTIILYNFNTTLSRTANTTRWCSNGTLALRFTIYNSAKVFS